MVPRLPWSSGERSEFHGGRVQHKTDGQPRNKHGAANASGAAGGERSAELRGDVFGRAAGLAARQRRPGRAGGHRPRGQAARRVDREPGHQRRAGPFRFRPGGHAPQPAAFSVSLGFFARGPGATGGAFSFRRGGCIAGGARHAHPRRRPPVPGVLSGSRTIREAQRRHLSTEPKKKSLRRARADPLPPYFFPRSLPRRERHRRGPLPPPRRALQTDTELRQRSKPARQAPRPDRDGPRSPATNSADRRSRPLTTTTATAAPPPAQNPTATIGRHNVVHSDAAAASPVAPPPRRASWPQLFPLPPPPRGRVSGRRNSQRRPESRFVLRFASGGDRHATASDRDRGAAGRHARRRNPLLPCFRRPSWPKDGASRTAARNRILLQALRPRRPALRGQTPQPFRQARRRSPPRHRTYRQRPQPREGQFSPAAPRLRRVRLRFHPVGGPPRLRFRMLR